MRLLLMLTILLLAGPAIAQDAAAIVQPEWAKTLTNPFVSGLIVSVLVQVIRAIPQIPIFKGPKVAALAALMSVVASLITASSAGELATFDVGSALTILVNFIVAFTTATGTAEATGHAVKALTPRDAPAPFAEPLGPPVEG